MIDWVIELFCSVIDHMCYFLERLGDPLRIPFASKNYIEGSFLRTLEERKHMARLYLVARSIPVIDDMARMKMNPSP